MADFREVEATVKELGSPKRRRFPWILEPLRIGVFCSDYGRPRILVAQSSNLCSHGASTVGPVAALFHIILVILMKQPPWNPADSRGGGKDCPHWTRWGWVSLPTKEWRAFVKDDVVYSGLFLWCPYSLTIF